MSDGCGRRQLGLFEILDPLGCSLKTLVRSYCTALSGLSLSWKVLGTSSSRKAQTGVLRPCALVLGLSERRTNGTECGSWGDWQTPSAVETGNNKGYQRRPDGSTAITLSGQTGAASGPPDWQTPSATCADTVATSRSGDRKDELLLGGQVRNWGTPRVTTNGGHPSPQCTGRGSRLEDQAAVAENWPTATASDFRSPCASEATHEKNSRPLSEVVGRQDQESPNTPGKPRGSLNSAWVAQLMSWPGEYMNALTELVTEYHLTKPRAPRTKACSE